MTADTVDISHITSDLDVQEFDAAEWQCATPVVVDRYWNGNPSPPGRNFEARLLWSDRLLYVRFEAAQDERLVISPDPDLTRKAMNLWDRDVCEIFIAPDVSRPNRYFEFEVAPTGEWIDLGIEVTEKGRVTDQEYHSGMEAAAKLNSGKVLMSVKIPFSSLDKTPEAGDVWFGNLFRCVGSDPDRGYLSWRPTLTERPSFHVPDRFGRFRFLP